MTRITQQMLQSVRAAWKSDFVAVELLEECFKSSITYLMQHHMPSLADPGCSYETLYRHAGEDGNEKAVFQAVDGGAWSRNKR